MKKSECKLGVSVVKTGTTSALYFAAKTGLPATQYQVGKIASEAYSKNDSSFNLFVKVEWADGNTKEEYMARLKVVETAKENQEIA